MATNGKLLPMITSCEHKNTAAQCLVQSTQPLMGEFRERVITTVKAYISSRQAVRFKMERYAGKHANLYALEQHNSGTCHIQHAFQALSFNKRSAALGARPNSARLRDLSS